MIFLAYLVTFILAQVGFIIGMAGSFLVALCLSWVPGTIGAHIRGFLGGVVCSATGVYAAKLSLGLFSFELTWLAVFYWLVIPVVKDIKKYREAIKVRETFTERLEEATEELYAVQLSLIIGYVAGAAMCGYYFLVGF